MRSGAPVRVLAVLALLGCGVRAAGNGPIVHGAIHKQQVFAPQTDHDGQAVGLLYAALPDGGMRVAAWGMHPVVEKYVAGLAQPPGAKESALAGLKEPVHTFVQRADNDYFVTASGKLYVAAKPASKLQSRKAEEVWAHAKRPITHVLFDVDNGRTFVFGREQDRTEDIRFGIELVGQRPTSLGSIAATFLKPNGAAEPLKTLMQYARYLRDEHQAKEDLRLLMTDKRLQAALPLMETDPDLHDLLQRLAKVTGLRFTLDKNLQDHRPLFGRVQMKHGTAWLVMDLIAKTQLLEGRWSKDGHGFQLTARESTSAHAQAARKADQAIEERLAKDRAERELLQRRFPLRFDAKCLGKFALTDPRPKLDPLLEDLREFTGLKLILADNLRRARPGSGSRHA